MSIRLLLEQSTHNLLARTRYQYFWALDYFFDGVIFPRNMQIDIISTYQWWSLETWSQSRDLSRDLFFGVSLSKVSGLVSVSVLNDFGLGLELFISRFYMGYFLQTFARSSIQNGYKKWLFKIQLFKEVSGKLSLLLCYLRDGENHMPSRQSWAVASCCSELIFQ